VIESIEKLEVGAGESAMAVCRPEGQLIDDITSLWSAHKEAKASARKTREELKLLRAQLGEKLHALKAHLARTGRSGRWSAFLRSNALQRATADRLVAKHEAAINPPSNRPSEAFSEPTEEEIRGLVRNLIPRLRRILVDGGTVDRFFAELNMQIPKDGFGQPEAGCAP
jgi:hypothetical protein